MVSLTVSSTSPKMLKLFLYKKNKVIDLTLVFDRTLIEKFVKTVNG